MKNTRCLKKGLWFILENYSFSICSELKKLNPFLDKRLSEVILHDNYFCKVEKSTHSALKLFLEKLDETKTLCLGRPSADQTRTKRPKRSSTDKLDKVLNKICDVVAKLCEPVCENRTQLLLDLVELESRKSKLFLKEYDKKFESFLCEIETLDFEKRSRLMYEKIKKITNRKPRIENPIPLSAWSSFYEKLYSPSSEYFYPNWSVRC